MDLGQYTVVQLKRALLKRRLPVSGNKNELMARIEKANPDGTWMLDCESDYTIDDAHPDASSDQEIPSATGEVTVQNIVDTTPDEMLREIELLRRERSLMEREMRVLERENQLMRNGGNVHHQENARTESPPKVNVKVISELLSEFDGSPTLFRNWEKQARYLIDTYQLDARYAKIMLGMRLKEKALEWFHSRPEHLELSIDNLLLEMQRMFMHSESKLKLRKKFEERQWTDKESFSAYYHDKLILANRLPIPEEEMVEYLIEGIANVQLRNQAKLQRFETKHKLLDAFETIDQKELKGSSENSKGSRKEKQEVGGPPKSTAAKESPKDRNSSQKKVRCYNCSKFGHVSTDCKAAKREKGTCFKCGEKGHIYSECKGNVKTDQVSVVETIGVENDFTALVTVKINDPIGKIEFKVKALLDTGSPITFIKEQFIPKYFIKKEDEDKKYCGLNNSKLEIIGIVFMDLQCDKLNTNGTKVYIVHDDAMSFPFVIGRNILTKNNVSLSNIIDTVNDNHALEIFNIDVIENTKQIDTLNVNPEISQKHKIKLENIYQSEYVEPPRPTESKVNAELKLQLNKVQPFHFMPRRLSYVEKENVRKILDNLMEKEIIKPSNSEYASPVILVQKKNKEYRMCVDYRTLNKYILRDNYPIPVIEDQLNVLKDKKYFTLLDLKDGFHHISMAKDSVKYTAFVTPFGQFEYCKMPFGLKTAPTRFQKFVNEILDELVRAGDVIVYIDNFLIATESIEHHLNVLKRVFELMVENKLDLRLDKCKFMYTEIEYLGYAITAKGIRPTDSGIEAVTKFPIPQTKHDVQRFIGMCSYFRKFIEGFAVIAKPLYDLLRKDVTFKFTEIELTTFEKLKSRLTTSPILAIYDPHDYTELHCDASSFGFGAVLVQRKSDHKLHPVFYFSKRTTPAETRYHSFELETLAIIYALKRFRIYLHGIPFKIITDCNALTLTLNRKEINSRIARWALELQSYEYTVEHRQGERMKHVDALNRSFTICIIEDNTMERNLIVCQMQDKTIEGLSKELEKTESSFYEMRNGLLYRKLKGELLFYVPQNMVGNILFNYHDQMGHVGIDKTTEAIQKNYWFPNMKTKIKEHISNCLKCIAYTPPSGKVEGTLHSIPKGNVPWDTLHVDHLGPIDKDCHVKRYIFLVVDAFSKYVKLYATKTTATKEAIESLKNYFMNYSKPRVIVSDRGSCFTSQEFESFTSARNIKHILIATDSPQSNGQVERINRIVIPMLSKLVDKQGGKQWYTLLDQVEYAINNTKCKSTGETPSRLLFGLDQRGACDDAIKEFLAESVKTNDRDLSQLRDESSRKIIANQEYSKRYFDNKHKKPLKYDEGDYVMLRNFDTTIGASKKLIPLYKGPYLVVKPLRNDRYVIADIPGCQNTQRKYQGVWEPKNMRPWLASRDGEIETEVEDDRMSESAEL